ncbi:MAG: DUF4974 domain-containing protein [Chlorobi bacterium]|nr:DUF4974 domain-containing protein [Chlorobiota bacterium]
MESEVKEEYIWTLIAKCAAGECNEKELIMLNKWKNEHPENSEFYNETVSVFKNAGMAINFDDIDEDVAWQKIKGRIDARKKKVKRLNLSVRVAAAVVLLLGFALSVAIWQKNRPEMNKVIAGAGEVVTFTLPDGSQVTLNSGSELTYPYVFNEHKRETYLKGEAFFSVVPGKDKPFIVNGGGFKVEVVGTEFNINARNDDAEVFVKSGIVKVETGKNRVVLTKGESALLHPDQNYLKKNNKPDINVIAWKTGRIIFDNTPLHEAFKTIENTYDINVEVEDSSMLKNRIINANFEKQTAEFILNTICDTYHFRLAKKDGGYMIKYNTANVD